MPQRAVRFEGAEECCQLRDGEKGGCVEGDGVGDVAGKTADDAGRGIDQLLYREEGSGANKGENYMQPVPQFAFDIPYVDLPERLCRDSPALAGNKREGPHPPLQV